MVSRFSGVVFAVLAAATLDARAGESLFRADATNGAITIREAHPSMLELLDRVILREREFAALAGTDYTASITFLGVPNAIGIDLNAAGTGATLSIPSINFSRDFSGADEGEVRRKIRDFLKREGADIVGRLRRVTRGVSAASVTDGNPDANTASAARSMFFTQGLTPASELVFDSGDRPVAPSGGLAVTARTAQMEIAGEDYTATQLRLAVSLFNLRLSDRVSLTMPVSADYVEIAGTEIYGGGAFLALPMRIQTMDARRSLGWRATPVFGGQTRVSFDAVSGAITWFAGLVNTVDYRVNPRLIVSVINQVSHHEGLPIAIQGFTFESDVRQIILKNGVRAMTPLGRGGRAGIHYLHTDFTHDAAVDSYHTAGVTVETRIGRSLSIGAVLESDWADGYVSTAGRLQFHWSW